MTCLGLVASRWREHQIYLISFVCSGVIACTDGSDPPLQAADSGVVVSTSPGGASAPAGNTGGLTGGAMVPVGMVGSGLPPIGAPDAAMLGVGGAAGSEAGVVVLPGSDAGAPVSTASGDAGAARPDAGPSMSAGARPKPFCVQKDSQVIVIGDSYISWISHSFPTQLARESGQSWRMEAVGGSSLGSGGIADIPSQFDLSIELDADAHTVLMDGGGNDVLLADPTLDPLGACTRTGSSMNQGCQEIVKIAVDAAKSLMDRMVTKGIRDVVYFFYPHVPPNTILTGDNPDEILDYALPKAKAVCDEAEQRTGGKLRCAFIDMIPVFAGKRGLFNSDIHPNDQGSDLMAKKVWEVMSAKCLGQKGPKECCESK